MQLYLLVILSSVFVIGNAVYTCTNGQKQCHLSSWLQWSNCTSSCGGGNSRRFKSLCCNTSYTSIGKCATYCNITTKDYVENKVCGQTCVNGVFRQNKCQCPQRFTGKCCESEITTLPGIHNGFTTPHHSSTITAKSCKQGCKFGDCNAGKCSCMTLFKGSTCNKLSSAVFRCGNGIKQCQLSQWGQWSNCTSPCGGGISMRYKHMCCNKTYSSFEKCVKDCNITTTDYSEMKICGKTCVNGVFRQNKCQCPNRFTGKCCETEIATIPVATNGLTASSSKTEITTSK
ncbi:WIF1 [Mytilus edulis]|uniref:WIF1 n=1 Tax=Mytilus edulis TaxID=6550 RepID=A0A8S3STA1_MYTED|nr:WIF1 [Mytilus edulis]